MRVCTRCGRTSDFAVAVCPGCQAALITAVAAPTDGSAALAIDPAEELAPGTLVGDYKIEKQIGQGGMGIVYGAIHPVIGKRAAIKVLNAKYCADTESLTRFLREAQAVNKIGHANIVDIFAFGELPDGRSYLVMEWLQGETLMDRLEHEAIPCAQTVEILIALTRALEAAHAAGVIHRDLKPENVILIPDDDAVRVKLLDFGIAKLETRRAPTSKTATGMTVGTPLYMSPEQAKGIGLDRRTDIYSLGILAYAMLCRTTPFEGEESPVEVLHAHISKPPKPPSELVADLPASLDTLILEMLAKNPEDRPALAEVRRRLKSLDGGSFETFTAETPLPARPQAQVGTIMIPRRRSPIPIILGVALLAVGAAVFVFTRGDDEPAATPAKRPVVTPPVATKSVEPPSPSVAPRLGTLAIVVEPVTATITVDGRPLAHDKGRASIELAEGDHKVNASATGYRAAEQTFAVTLERVTPATIKLAKARGATRPTKKPKDVDAVVDPFKKKKQK